MREEAKARGASVRLDAVRFSYGGGAGEMAFDLAVEGSARIALMGPSGSGKTTLLNLVAGFETPRAGRILIGGEDVTRLAPAQRPVSMVFQENNLFAHLDVAANIGLGRSPSLRLDGQDRDAVAQAIVRTGLAGKEKRRPAELSGGERQRVALARVLVRDRPVLLLDEAFAALGPALKREMLDLLLALHGERGMTILMATHDPDDAAHVAQTLVFVEDGRIAAVGDASAFLSGAGPEAFRRYIGSGAEAGRQGAARKPS